MTKKIVEGRPVRSARVIEQRQILKLGKTANVLSTTKPAVNPFVHKPSQTTQGSTGNNERPVSSSGEGSGSGQK